MRGHEAHDYSKDKIDVWYSRIIKSAHVAEFWLDLVKSIFLVLTAAFLGAFAGALIGAMLSNFWAGGLWAGMIVGALLGGLAGGKIAKRVFFGERAQLAAATAVEDTGAEEAVFAPHMPGVQEQFARARKREMALFLALLPSGMFLAYLYKAKPDWPVPGFLPRGQLIWAMLAFFLVMFVLLVLNARCPACRQRTGGLIRLRQCPMCGVAFRD